MSQRQPCRSYLLILGVWLGQAANLLSRCSVALLFACAIRTRPGDSIFTLHMMATGAVTKPDGSTMTPAALTGTPFSIANGACFKFTGQWGVSWDLYYFGPAAQAFIGMWSHNWAPGYEQAIRHGHRQHIRGEAVHTSHQDGGPVRRGGGSVPDRSAAQLT